MTRLSQPLGGDTRADASTTPTEPSESVSSPGANAAPAPLRRDERRRLAAAEALVIRDDPADLAESEAIRQDRVALHRR